MEHEGAFLAEASHEKAEFENDVVTGSEGSSVAADDQILGSEDQNGEIETRERVDQRIDVSGARSEKAVLPQGDLGISFERGTDTPSKIYTLLRGTNEEGWFSHVLG
jgi:hypothetical protein